MSTLQQAIECVEKATPTRWGADSKSYTKNIEEDIAFFENKVQNDLADAIIARLKALDNNTQI